MTPVEVLVVSQDDVPDLLPMDECIDAMGEALSALTRGDAVMPLRSVLSLPDDRGSLVTMPTLFPAAGVLGLKVITAFPGNQDTEFDSHQGAVMLFEAEHGRLMVIADATAITAIRTAAVSGLATGLLAREDAGDLAIIGTGTQAGTHLEAMRTVRELERVRVWSRNAARVRAFAARETQRHGLEVEAVGSAQEAVDGADLICTCTSASEPVVLGSWVSPGTHINAVGSSVPTDRELDTDLVARSRFYVDRRESAGSEAGDFLIPKGEGAIGDDHIVAELGEVVLGKALARSSSEEITVFKSLGLAVEDLASVQLIYGKAVAARRGTRIELGGRRHGDASSLG
jgi:alanine dehydrogenase